MDNVPLKTIDIYNYFDYREYLRAAFLGRKRETKGFSHRLFSREAGIDSPNYLLRVLQGSRNLGSDYIAKFCRALKLNRSESRYFTTLVNFNTEPTVAGKEKLLRDLLALRNRRGISNIDDKKLRFFSKWYYPVIRELAVILDCKDDFNQLARNCVPRITSQQAKNAVGYLVKNGFLKKNIVGSYVRTEPVISSGDEVKSTVLRNYHRQTLAQSIEALDTVDLENRDVSSLTLSVSRKTYGTIKKEIQEFRKRLLGLAREDTDAEMVCLAGFQLIPRSKFHSGKGMVR
jgi:uncharacterized protein (TIGR02147 family)